jgi:Putative lumazine-binding
MRKTQNGHELFAFVFCLMAFYALAYWKSRHWEITTLPACKPIAPAIAATLIATTTMAEPTHLEREAVLLPLHQYVRAHETGDAAFIQLAFAKDARIVGHLGGSKISWTVDEYATRFSGTPAADEARRRRHVELLSVTGDAAVALVTLDYPAVKFADYMALLKIDGQWKIVSKSFHAEPKPDATPR